MLLLEASKTHDVISLFLGIELRLIQITVGKRLLSRKIAFEEVDVRKVKMETR